MQVQEITDKTILLALDNQGGMCDRLMLGRKGIVSNANASIETWKFNAPDNEDFKDMKLITGTTDKDVATAITILKTDNYSILPTNNTIVGDDFVVGRNILNTGNNEHVTIVDINEVEFGENNLYNLY